MMDFVCFSQNYWEKRKARKQQFMLHLSKRADVGKVLYIEPPLFNIFRLLFFPVSQLKDPDHRKRWKRALSFKIEPLSNDFFLFTPLYFFPFSFHFQFIYDINLFISFLIIKSKIKKLGFKITILLDERIHYLSRFLKSDTVIFVKNKDDFLTRYIDCVKNSTHCFIIAPEFSKHLLNLTQIVKQHKKRLLSIGTEGILLGTSKYETYQFFKQNSEI